jgi:hypothetical protein
MTVTGPVRRLQPIGPRLDVATDRYARKIENHTKRVRSTPFLARTMHRKHSFPSVPEESKMKRTCGHNGPYCNYKKACIAANNS